MQTFELISFFSRPLGQAVAVAVSKHRSRDFIIALLEIARDLLRRNATANEAVGHMSLQAWGQGESKGGPRLQAFVSLRLY